MEMGILASSGGAGATAPAATTNEIKAATVTHEVAETRTDDSVADPDRQLVLEAVTQMQSYAEAAGRKIQFQLDDDSGRMIVRVTEASTGEVIRQMPSAEALRLAENLAEVRSVLFSAEI